MLLWDWINTLLAAHELPPVKKRLSLPAAECIGLGCEQLWKWLPLRGEPPMTRFVARELAKDHWFSIEAARRDLGYVPRISMAEGLRALVSRR